MTSLTDQMPDDLKRAHDRAVGQKWDDGKLDWHAMPLVILEPLVQVFEAGIKKGYGRHNCLNEFRDPDQRFFSGQLRHTVACQLDPLAKDDETGCYHSAQVAFNALMRLYHARKGITHVNTDDT